ncbi:hypothetical protein RRG08_027020 [Elysia crispata]|uniref:Uncharacterized protein n=1 Tax=Elysia crispata TaxID=231223 RepID=A0AAE1AJB9_9GAST|nr:hypothetical protein RRG08_027020 [Elysia crispata]
MPKVTVVRDCHEKDQLYFHDYSSKYCCPLNIYYLHTSALDSVNTRLDQDYNRMIVNRLQHKPGTGSFPSEEASYRNYSPVWVL